jgi:hypothetical protein
MEVSGQHHAPEAFSPGRELLVPSRWVGPRSGFDTVKILFVPARNQILAIQH